MMLHFWDFKALRGLRPRAIVMLHAPSKNINRIHFGRPPAAFRDMLRPHLRAAGPPVLRSPPLRPVPFLAALPDCSGQAFGARAARGGRDAELQDVGFLR